MGHIHITHKQHSEGQAAGQAIISNPVMHSTAETSHKHTSNQKSQTDTGSQGMRTARTHQITKASNSTKQNTAVRVRNTLAAAKHTHTCPNIAQHTHSK